jgi:hypothetical protein
MWVKVIERKKYDKSGSASYLDAARIEEGESKCEYL